MSRDEGRMAPDIQFCPRCGELVHKDARFCPICGTSVSAQPVRSDQQIETLTPDDGHSDATHQESELRELEYMGFWVRALAFSVDLVVIFVLEGLLLRTGIPILAFLAGPTYLVLLIGLRGQTLGKMVLEMEVVNSRGQVPGIGTALLREVVGKFVSTIALLLGYIWVGLDSNKRGWHDHIAGTCVVRKTRPR